MRTHLLNAVTVNREMGQSEDEAMQNAIVQFGTSAVLAENVVWAWRRGEWLCKKSLLGAALSTLALLNSLPYLSTLLMCNFVVPFAAWMRGTYHWPDLAVMSFVFLVMDAPTWFLIGAFSSRFFPKKAVAGTSYVMAAWIVLRIAQSVWTEFVDIPDSMVHGYFHRRSDYRSVEDITIGLFFDMLLALVAILGAWAGSQSQMVRKGQGRRARD